MVLKKLQGIKKEREKSIKSKSIVKSPVSNNLVDDIKESLESIKNGHSEEEEIKKELLSICRLLKEERNIIEEDCWDSLRHSLANSEPLSDKYNIEVAYENLNIVVQALNLLHNGQVNEREALDAALSLQTKMKEALEKTQQQQSAARQKELEEKAKEEFGKYIENGTIDTVSIASDKNTNLLCTKIKLKDNNKNTDIRVS
ncbi:hypothetical protein [Wolbachia endosymbiont (group B) of Erebia ligea]|uniref:hypothetical protein n=1 Tax=Wolbachia endosymbiont (group B) of Erebia ligea TaxID=2954010 RepID=UPI0021F89646|nr:hypothetical protein [Wolbachia endosymbiont (group B) of Erebia ligea]